MASRFCRISRSPIRYVRRRFRSLSDRPSNSASIIACCAGSLKSSGVIPPALAERKQSIARKMFDLPALFSPTNPCSGSTRSSSIFLIDRKLAMFNLTNRTRRPLLAYSFPNGHLCICRQQNTCTSSSFFVLIWRFGFSSKASAFYLLGSSTTAWLNAFEPIGPDSHCLDHLGLHAKAIVLEQVAEAVPVDQVDSNCAGSGGLLGRLTGKMTRGDE